MRKAIVCDRDSCVSGRVTVPLDSQSMSYEPDPPADCFWTKQVFSKSVSQQQQQQQQHCAKLFTSASSHLLLFNHRHTKMTEDQQRRW